MIISFRFKNFRSFYDETFIDMKTDCCKDFTNHLAPFENKYLLKTLAVYGNDASGKTNLLLAFSGFQALIFKQLFPLKTIPGIYLVPHLRSNSRTKIIPYQITETDPQPTEMELSFLSNRHIYEYGFTIKDQNILAEHLIVDHHMVYTRTDREIFIWFIILILLNHSNLLGIWKQKEIYTKFLRILMRSITVWTNFKNLDFQ